MLLISGYQTEDNSSFKIERPVLYLNYFKTGDRPGSIKRRNTEDHTPNELKEKNKLIEAEKTETGSVSNIINGERKRDKQSYRCDFVCKK